MPDGGAPRPVTGVRVDHSGPGGGRVRIAFEVDVEPLPGGAAGGLEFAAALPKTASAPAADVLARLGRCLGEAWRETGGGSRPLFRARAVLREARWHGDLRLPGAADTVEQAARLAVDEAERALAEDRAPRPVGREALGRPPALPRAVRGVYVRNIVQTSCFGPWAVVWADAEPLPGGAADDLEFATALPATCPLPDEPLPDAYAAAFGRGAREVLERRGRGRPVFAARLVLRDAVWSEVDSTERGFCSAGRLAAAEVLRCVAQNRDPRPVGRGADLGGPVPPMPGLRRRF